MCMETLEKLSPWLDLVQSTNAEESTVSLKQLC